MATLIHPGSREELINPSGAYPDLATSCVHRPATEGDGMISMVLAPPIPGATALRISP